MKLEKDGDQPVHGLVGGLGQKRVARLHLPATDVLLTAAVSLKGLRRVCLRFEGNFDTNILLSLGHALLSRNYRSLTFFIWV